MENNGKNLKEIYVRNDNVLINLDIAKYSPNLKPLIIKFKDDEIETLKAILNHRQHLETIEVWCGDYYLNENELLEVVAKYSPKKFYRFKIHFTYSSYQSGLFPEESRVIGFCNTAPFDLLCLYIYL